MSLLLTLGLGSSGAAPTPPTGGDTPYMSLLLPTVSVTLGPLYATEVNAAFLRVDQHDHTSGYGKLVPSAGLNINADLPFNNFNLTNAKSVGFAIQSPTVGAAASLYFQGRDLYALDGAGAAVRITLNGAVNITGIGGWTGLLAPAAATYDPVTTKFALLSDTNKHGLFDIGDIHLYVANSLSGVYTALASGAASTYTLTTPSALPAAATKRILQADSTGQMSFGPSLASIGNTLPFMRMDNTGNLAADTTVDTVTMQMAGTGPWVLGVKTGGITNNQVAAGSLQPSRLALVYNSAGALSTFALNITPVLVNSIGLVVSGTRPVQISLVSTDATIPGFSYNDPGAVNTSGFAELRADGVTVNRVRLVSQALGVDVTQGANCLSCVLPVPAAGVRSYTVYIYTNSVSGGSITATGIAISAQEI